MKNKITCSRFNIFVRSTCGIDSILVLHQMFSLSFCFMAISGDNSSIDCAARNRVLVGIEVIDPFLLMSEE